MIVSRWSTRAERGLSMRLPLSAALSIQWVRCTVGSRPCSPCPYGELGHGCCRLAGVDAAVLLVVVEQGQLHRLDLHVRTKVVKQPTDGPTGKSTKQQEC